jgi:hypothetical protein
VSARAQTLAKAGFGALDAAHVACANAADGLEAPAVAAPERHEDAKGENPRLLSAPAVFPTLELKLAVFLVVFTPNCRAKITNGNSRSAQEII